MKRLRQGALLMTAVAIVPVFDAAGWARAAGTTAREACAAPKQQAITPVLLKVAREPVPVKGSDGRYHVVYELQLTNFGSDPAAIQQAEVLDAGSGASLATLPASQIANWLQGPGVVDAGTLGPGGFGFLFVSLSFDAPKDIPPGLEHRLDVAAGDQSKAETAACTALEKPTDLVLEPYLRGKGYLAGDGCCESTLHIRAALPVNGAAALTQRFAIDWQQLDAQGRIYAGDPSDVRSYTIYGQKVHAVTDAKVVQAVDGLPDQVPGTLPEGLPIDEIDGNSVVLDLGDGRYAFYAHMQPHSLRVKTGDEVKAGDVIGLVGNSGNTDAPHMHFHVMDGRLPVASDGLPYLLTRFSASRRGVSHPQFLDAQDTGVPLETEPVGAPGKHTRELPLDLWITDFR
jgi:murein DD-endopeptidase MepM/ murein hydrolase activator NlpD